MLCIFVLFAISRRRVSMHVPFLIRYFCIFYLALVYGHGCSFPSRFSTLLTLPALCYEYVFLSYLVYIYFSFSLIVLSSQFCYVLTFPRYSVSSLFPFTPMTNGDKSLDISTSFIIASAAC